MMDEYHCLLESSPPRRERLLKEIQLTRFCKIYLQRMGIVLWLEHYFLLQPVHVCFLFRVILSGETKMKSGTPEIVEEPSLNTEQPPFR